MAANRKSPASSDDALLTELRERYTYAVDQWRPIKDEAAVDMRYVAGDPWDPKDRKQREDAGRVCLSLDELHQYFNQLINDVRANPRAPKFDPVGNGANDKTSRFYADKMREIEYRSQAQIAYTTAFQNAVHRSYGWFRFLTKYALKGFDQDIWIEDIPNPDLVVGDPDALRPSSSDQKYLFYLQSRSVAEFRREFPDAQITDFSPEVVSRAPAWVGPERVQLAEYWTVKPVEKELLLLQWPDPQTGQPKTGGFYADELEQMPPGATVINRRLDGDATEVCMYLTNGVEILRKPGQTEKKVRWAGKYIPFVSCFGMIIYVDEGAGPTRKILSMTRLARDPYMLYCYYRTCEAEVVGMTPKIPYFVRRGSLKPEELTNLQKSLHEPVAVIQVEGFVDGFPQPPEFPVRNPYEPFIQQLEVGAEAARRAIQAAMGISPLPTQAQRRNEKSGIALQQIESSQQKGSFHFIDHYEAMLQHGGVIAEDLMDKVYDTARDVGIRDAKDTAKTVRINDPQAQGPEDMASVRGDHIVTITTGPAFESQRQEGANFTDSLVSNLQVVAATAGPKPAAALLGMAIKLKNLGELGDEMAKIVTPPEYQAQDGQPPSPELQAMKGQLQQAEQIIQQLGQKLETKQIERETDLQKAAMDNTTRLTIARETATVNADKEFKLQEMKNAAQIAVAHIAAASKGAALDAHALEESQALDHEAQQADASRAHEAQMAAQGYQQEREGAEHDAELSRGGAEHEAELARANAEHQVAITPPEETGA